jgi:hypothetical protein
MKEEADRKVASKEEDRHAEGRKYVSFAAKITTRLATKM